MLSRRSSLNAETQERLRAAFASLPQLTQEVFWAHRIDGLTYPEIAERTGVSVRQIEREIARALYSICLAMEAAKRSRRSVSWRWHRVMESLKL